MGSTISEGLSGSLHFIYLEVSLICFCCNIENLPRAVKNAIAYSKCHNCGSIYTTQDISKVMETDNDQSYERNSLPNNTVRLKRAEEALGRKVTNAFDFGCGQGFLINFLTSNGIEASGINYETKELINYLPDSHYDVVFMIEVIEHLTNAKEIFEKLSKTLKPNGIVLIETTFADQIHDLVQNPYVDPKIGHVNVVSRAGLPKLLPKDLMVSHWVNRNICVLRRV
jgi:SAM-dependent methyltransferase